MGHSGAESQDFDRLVLVADLRENDDLQDLSLRHDLEMSDPRVVSAIRESFSNIGVEVVHYQGPDELAATGKKHRSDLILSIYGGKRSRSRMCLVPAVCEALGLPYLGPDAYARAICQNKEISKELAHIAGFQTAPHILIRTQEDCSKLDAYSVPYVLKPSLEGTSIGIRRNSLIDDPALGPGVASALLREFDQPILAETFVPGREVSLNFIECPEGLDIHMVETRMKADPNFFDHGLYDAETKAKGGAAWDVVRVESKCQTALFHQSTTLLKMIGATSYGRVDGKLVGDDFVFLEITPDAFLAPWGLLAEGFRLSGKSYEDVLHLIINAKRPRLPDLVANG